MPITKQAFGSILRTSSRRCFLEFDQVMDHISDQQVKISGVCAKPAPKLHAKCSDLNYPDWISLDYFATETKYGAYQEILQ